jgi:excisionase family DNA binding protein
VAQSRSRKRPDPRRAKTHHSYTLAEAASLFGVHRNTVRNWTRSGLDTVRAGATVLILGDELRAYLTRQRRKRHVRCPPGSMFCMKCREPRRPPAELTELVPLTPTTVNLRGLCPDCGSMMHRRANLGRLGEVGFGHLTPTPAGAHIADSPAPTVNCHFS